MLKKSIEQYQIITQERSFGCRELVDTGPARMRVSQNSVEAEKAFKQALDRDANNEDALTGLAMVYSDVGDTKNMIEMLGLRHR